jgi:hypothetical protein
MPATKDFHLTTPRQPPPKVATPLNTNQESAMRTSESISEIATAMNKAQAQLGGAVKDAANPFFKSKYADLASVVKAVKQPFADNGLSYVQFPISEDNRIGIVTRLMHSSGEWLEREFAIPYTQIDPQKAGSVLTYFRRYSLAAVAGVPQVDDDAELAMARDQVDERKEAHDEAYGRNVTSVIAIKDALAEGNYSAAFEAWNEIADDDKGALWLAPTKGGCFTTKERAQMKSNEWNDAKTDYFGGKAA